MTNIIALTQFVFIALGTMAANILVKTGAQQTTLGQGSETLNGFLANNGIWLLLVPIVWTAFAHACTLLRRGDLVTKIVHPVGIALTAAIFVLYAYAVYFSY